MMDDTDRARARRRDDVRGLRAGPGRRAPAIRSPTRSTRCRSNVASRTLTETTWNATLLEGDAVEAVAALKQQPGENLLKYGTGEFSKALLEAGLIDELHLWVFPVVAGKGDRLLEGLDLTHYKLVDSSTFQSGIVVHVLDPHRVSTSGARDRGHTREACLTRHHALGCSGRASPRWRAPSPRWS